MLVWHEFENWYMDYTFRSILSYSLNDFKFFFRKKNPKDSKVAKNLQNIISKGIRP